MNDSYRASGIENLEATRSTININKLCKAFFYCGIVLRKKHKTFSNSKKYYKEIVPETQIVR